ncbi:CDGSH iron-sulfur domain-containing protein [Caproicibacterium sp. NSD3]
MVLILFQGMLPIAEKIIAPKGKTYEFKEKQIFPQSEHYAICRCGESHNKPFCDETRVVIGYISLTRL